MLRRITGLIAFMSILAMAAPAMGHGLWVNVYKNEMYSPGHAIATVGFGHISPLDDLLTSDVGKIEVGTYQLVDPDNNKTDLPIPKSAIKKIPTSAALKITTGELGASKFAFKSDTKPGTYQVNARAKDTFFTVWIDKNGKRRKGTVAIDQIDNPKKIILSLRYLNIAKSCFSVGKWTKPVSQGYPLEITPISDLSNVRPGDLVEFEVTFGGRPLSIGAEGLFQMTGISRSFGGKEKTFIMSYPHDGRCRFTMPTVGQWLMQINVMQKVADRPELADLKGKCLSIYYTSSFTFNVKP